MLKVTNVFISEQSSILIIDNEMTCQDCKPKAVQMIKEGVEPMESTYVVKRELQHEDIMAASSLGMGLFTLPFILVSGGAVIVLGAVSIFLGMVGLKSKSHLRLAIAGISASVIALFLSLCFYVLRIS